MLGELFIQRPELVSFSAERILYARLTTPVHVDLSSKGSEAESNRDLEQITCCHESERGVQYRFAGEKWT
jgi:hypothetical protein